MRGGSGRDSAYPLRILNLTEWVDVDLFGFPYAFFGICAIVASFRIARLDWFFRRLEMADGSE